MVMSAGGDSIFGGGVASGSGRGGGDLPCGEARGVGVSSSSSNLCFAGGVSVGFGEESFFRLLTLGLASSSSSSASAFFFAAGVFAGSGLGEDLAPFPFPFFFAAFGFPVGVEDSAGVGEATVCISSRAFRNASRFFLSASEICAWRSVASTMLHASPQRIRVVKVANQLEGTAQFAR